MKDVKDVNELYLLDPTGFVERLTQAMNEAKKLDARLVTKEDNRESKNEFRLKTLTELLNEPDEDIDWLAHELLPLGGVSIDAAKPKVGKTTKNKTLARLSITGGSFLGREIMATGQVLYYALEEKKRAFMSSFRKMGFIKSDNLRVHFGMAPAEPLKALENDIKKHTPVLVVIDPLLRFIRVDNLNDYALVSLALEPINELARKYNCHIMCVHHLGKMNRDDGDDVLGSTALFGSVDTLLLTKKDADGLRKISSIQRYGEDLPEMVLELDKDTDVVSVAGTYAEVQKQQEEKKILELRDNILDELTEKPITQEELRERLGSDQTLSGKTLRQMVKEGLVKRTGKGRKNSPYKYAKLEQDKALPSSKIDSEKPDSSLSPGENQESSIPNTTFPDYDQPHTCDFQEYDKKHERCQQCGEFRKKDATV